MIASFGVRGLYRNIYVRPLPLVVFLSIYVFGEAPVYTCSNVGYVRRKLARRIRQYSLAFVVPPFV